MIWVFIVVLAVTSAFLVWRKAVGRKTWIAIIVLAMLFSLFVAYISVANVWTPGQLSDDVFRKQNDYGEFSGTLPWSRFSYPLSLMVFQTPFVQLTYDYPYAYGKAEWTISFADFSLVHVKGNYSYYYPIMGPSPLHYQIDNVFSHSFGFFESLVWLFTIFNFAAAVVAIIIASGIRTIRWRRRIRP
jgi:hypothetical protein